ncbi:ABC transporter substrate-binding protein [Streptomyces sp. NPDC090112]|uniref:ABC transporter substrate-binding protein n=1 Tax=Streptomyces sp. NPDC090112 TaxID=3365949 RepID=UPI003804A0F6
MPSPRLTATALVAVMALATAACGGTAEQDGKERSQSPASTTATAGYPVTLENCGTRQTFTKAPERVVVMNGASVAEVSTLLALGVQDRIVANQQSYGLSEVPGRADAIKALPNGGIEQNDAFDISRESMLQQRPDLVLSNTSYGFNAKNGFATRDQLAQVNSRTYISPQGCDEDPSRMTLQDSYALLRDMGKVFGAGDRAEKIIAESQKRIADISAKVEGKPKPKTMVIFSNMSMGANEFSAVAARGIYNDILAKAGGTNAFESASDTSFADLSKEKVAATDVEALVVIAYNDPNVTAYAQKLLKEFPQWTAAKNNTYAVLSDSMYLGPSNDLAVEKLAKALHPDAF